MPSTKAFKQGSGERSSSLATDKSLTPSEFPKAGTYHPRTTTELPERESLLARSFRKLSAVLRLSLIGKTFKSKSHPSLGRSKASQGWSDIVDCVIEDSHSESHDSYLDFMHGRKKGRTASRKKYWLARNREKEGENVVEKVVEVNEDGEDHFVPWFEESK